MKSKKIKSYQFGILSEFIAIFFLKLKGYKILRRRYKTKLGEIDIIAKKGQTIVAIEVKARKKLTQQNRFLTTEVLHQKQKNRIKRAALSFLTAHTKYHNHSLRFDLIVISPYKIPLHLINFWE